MGKQLIDGVTVKDLKLVPDNRGFLMEMMRTDWPEFKNFSQSYVTCCYPRVIKAWHYHKKQIDHFVCLSGMAHVVLYDDRQDSPTKGEINEFHIGPLSPSLLVIPNFVWHGFAAEGSDPALIVNFPTELYDYQTPDEYRKEYDDPDIPFDWDSIHG